MANAVGTHPTMYPGYQHAQQKNAAHRAKANAANGVDNLQYGGELLHDYAAKYTIDAGKEDKQLHDDIGLVLRMVYVGLDVVKVNDAAQRIDASGKCAQRSAENAGDEDAWHSGQMTNNILHKIRHHFVQLADQALGKGIAIMIASIHHDARKAIEAHDDDKAQTEKHQRSARMRD